MVRVRKGTIETNVTEETLPRYLKSGWERVNQQKKQRPKTYNDYKKDQLISIAANRSLHVNTRMKKQEIIDRLVTLDERAKVEPTNQGFTDNLIKQ